MQLILIFLFASQAVYHTPV
uniref:Uncharacterized protein n=1 Tax=Arundo donax TaxID=35708 RepID=A0A0A9QD09_ARUDO